MLPTGLSLACTRMTSISLLPALTTAPPPGAGSQRSTTTTSTKSHTPSARRTRKRANSHQAGHQIVVLAGSPCKPGETAGSIELLPPTPDVVELVPLCRSDRGLTGALVIHPANKDLGLHTVKLRTVGCDGSGTEYLFEVKVKRP